MCPESSFVLCFVDVIKLPDDSFRGACLTTDEQTRPLELRVTSPIKPTHQQVVIYGDSFERYVYSELMAVPLIKAAKYEPNLIIIRNRPLFHTRTKIEIPLLLVTEDMSALEAHDEYPSDVEQGKTVFEKLPVRWLEPFERLESVIHEVHEQNIGVQGKLGG